MESQVRFISVLESFKLPDPPRYPRLAAADVRVIIKLISKYTGAGNLYVVNPVQHITNKIYNTLVTSLVYTSNLWKNIKCTISCVETSYDILYFPSLRINRFIVHTM